MGILGFIRSRVHFHWQNLSADDSNDPSRRPLRGRAWWRTVGDKYSWRFEWNLLAVSKGAVSYEADDGEGEHLFHVSAPGASLWLALRPPWRWREHRMLKYLRPLSHRKIGVDVHDGRIWWLVWMDPDCSSSKDPKYRRGSFDPMQFVFGQEKRWREEVVDDREMLVPMPEGSYLARVKISRSWWGYARLPKTMQTSAHVDLSANPIPFSGKGENSWDCGEDAMYGLYTAATTPDEAVGKVVASATRTRRQRGDPAVWPKTPAEQLIERAKSGADA